MSENHAVPSDDAPHLLVVDDDTRIRNLLKQFLTEHGFRVTVAGTADEARRKLAGLDFDLIIMDVMMPRMDGWTLASKVKAESRLKNVPLIFLTGRDSPKDVVQGINAGARHYLTKPFKIQTLLEKVGKAIGEKK